jgi:hypothetical protein
VGLLGIVKEEKIIFARKSGRIFGLILTILGLVPIVIALSNAWISGVSFLNLSVLYEFLWTNYFDAGFGVKFELFYLVIAGVAAIILGVFLFMHKTEHIEEMVVVVDDLTVTLKCTNCSHEWKERFSKAQLQAMGFPQNRTISRRRCPNCKKFTRPKITQI